MADRVDKLREEKATRDYIYKLTPTKRRLYNTLIDPEYIGLNVTDICGIASVDRSTYYRLMRDEEFVESVKKVQFDLVEARLGDVVNATYKYAMDKSGHQDRKMLLTMAGLYADKTETKLEGAIDIGQTSDMLRKYLTDEETGDVDGG